MDKNRTSSNRPLRRVLFAMLLAAALAAVWEWWLHRAQ
jgi:hypothetical protein